MHRRAPRSSMPGARRRPAQRRSTAFVCKRREHIECRLRSAVHQESVIRSCSQNGASWPEVRVLTNRRKAAIENSNILAAAPSSNWCYRPGTVIGSRIRADVRTSATSGQRTCTRRPRSARRRSKRAADRAYRGQCRSAGCVIDIWARVLPLPRYSEWPGQPATAARPASEWRPSRLVIKSLRITK